jgi:hypothetical protein
MKNNRKTNRNRKYTGGKEQAEKYNQIIDVRVGRPLTDQELRDEERQYQERMRQEERRQQAIERQRQQAIERQRRTLERQSQQVFARQRELERLGQTGTNTHVPQQSMMELLNIYTPQDRGGKRRKTKRTKKTKRRSRSKK